MPTIVQCRQAMNLYLPFNGPKGPPGFVPIAWVPVTLTGNEKLDVRAACTLSARPTEIAGYGGFNPEWFGATELVITQTDLTGAKTVDLENACQAIDLPNVADGWYADPDTPHALTNAYEQHVNSAWFDNTLPDNGYAGPCWIALVGWVSSYAAAQADTIAIVQNQAMLDLAVHA